MPTEPKYIDYTDQVVESILKDESLSDDEKYRRVTERYIERLKSGGRSPAAVKQQEKEIREEISYHRKKVETNFELLSDSKDEDVLNMVLAPVRLKEKAIKTASAEIIKHIDFTAIPHKDQHEFNEAKRTGFSVTEVKGQHAAQLKDAQEFYKEVRQLATALLGYPILISVAGIFLLIFSSLPSGSISYVVGIPMAVILISGFFYIVSVSNVSEGAWAIFFVYPYFLFLWFREWLRIKKSISVTRSHNDEARIIANKAMRLGAAPLVVIPIVAIGFFAYQSLAKNAKAKAINTNSPVNQISSSSSNAQINYANTNAHTNTTAPNFSANVNSKAESNSNLGLSDQTNNSNVYASNSTTPKPTPDVEQKQNLLEDEDGISGADILRDLYFNTNFPNCAGHYYWVTETKKESNIGTRTILILRKIYDREYVTAERTGKNFRYEIRIKFDAYIWVSTEYNDSRYKGGTEFIKQKGRTDIL